MGKLGETNDGRLKEMDRQIEDYEMDIKQRAGKLGDEQRILNLGIDALKDFATEVIMGKSSIYQDMDLSKKKIDLMAQTDAADLRDALWGKGALSPEAKRAKAGLMSAVDQVLENLRRAKAAAPGRAAALTQEAAVLIRQQLDTLKELPGKNSEMDAFIDDVQQSAMRLYMKESGFDAVTIKNEKDAAAFSQSNLERALEEQSSAYDDLRAAIRADIRGAVAPGLAAAAGVSAEEANRRLDARRGDPATDVDTQMADPSGVVSSLERQLDLQMGAAEEAPGLGRTVVLVGGSAEGGLPALLVSSLGEAAGGAVEAVSAGALGALDPYSLKKAYADLSTVVAVVADAEGKGGGGLGGLFGGGGGGGKDKITPELLEQLLKAPQSLRRCVVVSASGTTRADTMPFSLRNVGGDLDRQKAAEQVAKVLATTRGFDCAVVHAGKVVPGAGPGPALELQPGDALDGETTQAMAAAVVEQTLLRQRPLAGNATFSVASAPGSGPALPGDLDDQFLKLRGPEVWRRPVDTGGEEGGRVSAAWLAEWAARWDQPGSGLTTPVKITQLSQGVKLEFVPSKSGDFSTFKEEKEQEKAKEKGKAVPNKGATSKDQGGLDILLETIPYPRIRVSRCSYGPGTVVKEMSEDTILKQLQKDVARRMEK